MQVVLAGRHVRRDRDFVVVEIVAGQPGSYVGAGGEYYRLPVAFESKSEGEFPVARRYTRVIPP